MTMTTIKVDTVVRDRLAAVAEAKGITMAALLRDISSELEEQQRWVMIEESYERLRREDPDGWAEYLAELRTWDSVSADPGNAAAEWPEYNR
jgi:predicted DNA-binding protein